MRDLLDELSPGVVPTMESLAEGSVHTLYVYGDQLVPERHFDGPVDET